jgi:hypothetical protein
MEAWKNSEQITILMVRIMRSTLPFCREVYGHDMRNRTTWESRKDHLDTLLNSFPLSIVQLSSVEIYAKKLDKVVNVSNCKRKGKVHK